MCENFKSNLEWSEALASVSLYANCRTIADENLFVHLSARLSLKIINFFSPFVRRATITLLVSETIDTAPN